MYSVEANTAKTLIVISAAGRVTRAEVEIVAAKVRELVRDFAPGFKALADFRFLDAMESTAATPLASIMDALAEKQVTMVVRVLADPRKDIGLAILSHFHYGREIEVVTCETLSAALDLLMQ